jgi:GMP synthase-like glutamine amidotransferase
MRRQVLIVKNISREGPGLLDLVLKEHEITSRQIDLSRGETIPDPARYSAVFVFGGPDSANDQTRKMQEELRTVKEICEREIPLLGVCLGMQVLIKANGGEVCSSPRKEIGWRDTEGNYFEVDVTEKGSAEPLLDGVNSPFKVFQLHGETVRLRPDMTLLGKGKFCESQLVRVGRNAYGIQGHIELTPSMLDDWIDQDPDLQTLDSSTVKEDYRRIKTEYEQQGRKILTNFLKVAKLA